MPYKYILIWECPPLYQDTVLVLVNLPIKLWNLCNFAYKIQIRHVLICWNPLSIADKKRLRLYQFSNSRYVQCLLELKFFGDFDGCFVLCALFSLTRVVHSSCLAGLWSCHNETWGCWLHITIQAGVDAVYYLRRSDLVLWAGGVVWYWIHQPVL